MLISFSLIFLVGLLLSAICEKIKLPGIIGMIFGGIILFALNLLDSSVLDISSQLRQIALIIILIKAGLTLDIKELKKVGIQAVLMSFVPASTEIVGYILFAPLLLGVTRAEAAVIGAVLAAVSPAVVVPRMIKISESHYGGSIPSLIMAGASCDDIFVLILFSAFVNMASGQSVNFLNFLNIPISIILGVFLGLTVGLITSKIISRTKRKTIILLALAFLITGIETLVKDYVAVSGLLGVVSMACVIKLKCPESADLSRDFGKLWSAAEVVLFVLVGAAVDIRYTLSAGFSAVGLIFIALIFRSAGVLLCLIGTPFSFKEKLFCVLAYLPKATVQAAIGSIPLSFGLPCGNTVLSVAVLGILITAPLGAFGIDFSYKKLLKKNDL